MLQFTESGDTAITKPHTKKMIAIDLVVNMCVAAKRLAGPTKRRQPVHSSQRTLMALNTDSMQINREYEK
jgi:hypothetical protein